MPGRGVHEAGAGVGGDVIAGKERHFEVVTLAEQRVAGDLPRRIEIAETGELDLRMAFDLRGQHIGEHEFLTGLR